MFDAQQAFRARCEWGEAGVQRLAPLSDIVVVVDVLSFSTAVDIAVARGAVVYPCRWRDDRADRLASEVDAVLAVPRSGPGQAAPYSLSPASLRAIPAGTRLVLPSPNGATLSQLAAAHCPVVLAGCLRNAAAVGSAVRELGGTVAVIAAGERWVDAGDLSGSLRPAVEDLAGAGAILAALASTRPSPEALVALATWHAAQTHLDTFLAACASGQELRDRGFTQDVELAGQLDVSRTVPHLVDGAFRAWGA